ncbi:MAG: hypothetical protein JWO77_3186 [Ilumatobacteraceae bacterium]|nr:hypothetical protein [Ilumatobacteraceae bacterium]
MVGKLVLGAVAVLLAVQAVPAPISAQRTAPDPVAELPPGFTDGEPVGSADAPPPAPSAGADAAPGRPPGSRVTNQRYFGREPWQAVRASASATSRSCTISDDGLTAMVVAPVFKESSAAVSPSTAPAPMTLSRYDEWNGTYATTSNQSANYGLYAFRNPDTAYKRAFWHPGIGIWQYDSAGVGAPFTAIERMDVRTTSADVAKGLAARYCNPSASVVGHGPPYTALERRHAAWTPWGYPCTSCEQEFQAMTIGTVFAANTTLVDGISVTGGAEQRTCTLAGVAGTVACWYVDPSVGTIQGATGWARITPLDGGSPTSMPTPLAAPFYVVDRGATEERHWLRADTGFAIDIAGSRTIGTNERPRSNQAGSGVTWRSGSGLCDLTTGHGACLPPAPAGLTLTESVVNGSFRPIALDAQGDGRGDVLWYAPGAPRDYLWSGGGAGAFRATAIDIGGTYDDVLPFDADADGDDDILWYNRSTGAGYLWVATGAGTWQAVKVNRPKGLRPIVIDTDGNGRDEVFWYGPGSAPDALWSWNGSAFTSRPQAVGGSYRPVTGDFDGNAKGDLLWYGPGSAADHLWLSTGAGAHRDVAISISGSYLPLVGDFEGDGNDDVLWYGSGSSADHIWFGGPGGRFAAQTVAVGGTYQPRVADLEADGRDDIIWYAPGPPSDVWWRWSTGRTVSSAPLLADGSHQAVVGGFGRNGGDGIFWYAPGATPDGVWWR